MYYYLVATYYLDECLDAETELCGPFETLEQLDEHGNSQSLPGNANHNITILRVQDNKLERIYSELLAVEFEFAETLLAD